MLNNLGMAYGVQRMAESVTSFEHALSSTAAREHQGEARACYQCGHAASIWAVSTRRWLASIRWSSSGGRARYGEGMALDIVGSAYRELGRFDEAGRVPAQALAIFRDLGDLDSEADPSATSATPISA